MLRGGPASKELMQWQWLPSGLEEAVTPEVQAKLEEEEKGISAQKRGRANLHLQPCITHPPNPALRLEVFLSRR